MSGDYIVNPDKSLQHRVVAERFIGRKLNSKEIVHHINGDTMDNRVINLIVFESNAAHLRYHNKKVIDRMYPPDIRNKEKELKGMRADYGIVFYGPFYLDLVVKNHRRLIGR